MMTYDEIVHKFFNGLSHVFWHETTTKGIFYYYAESELYIIHDTTNGGDVYDFIRARSPQEALDYYLKRNA